MISWQTEKRWKDWHSFDQEGVQLGKVLAKRVLAHETDGALKVFSDLLNI